MMNGETSSAPDPPACAYTQRHLDTSLGRSVIFGLASVCAVLSAGPSDWRSPLRAP